MIQHNKKTITNKYNRKRERKKRRKGGDKKLEETVTTGLQDNMSAEIIDDMFRCTHKHAHARTHTHLHRGGRLYVWRLLKLNIH